jgi:hypothetical protein
MRQVASAITIIFFDTSVKPSPEYVLISARFREAIEHSAATRIDFHLPADGMWNDAAD